jgi:two-component system cell cycle sensor histidine kinase/response regulator CckA
MPESTETNSRRPLRVLLVEDNEYDAELIIATLKRAGYPLSFERVDKPEEFRKRVLEGGHDLILADHNLRTWTGADALKILGETKKNLPFIIVTGTLGDEAAVDYIKGGAADYVLKYRLERLPDAVGRVMREKDLVEEQQRANVALRESEERFRLIAENVADLIAVLDLEGNRLYNSPSYTEVLGDPDKLLGTPSFDDIHPDDRERIKSVFRETVRTGQVQRTEYRFLLKDGSIRYIESQGSLIRDAQGNPSKVLVVSRDVTARKRAEETLRGSEVRFRRLFEAARDGILILDYATGNIADVNPFLEELLGYPKREMLGQKLWEMGPFRDMVASKLSFEELRDKGYVRCEDLPLQTRGGRLAEVEFVSNVYEVNGQKVIQCNIRDITARKKAERSLVQLRAAVDASGEVIFMTDPEGVITFVNPEFTRLYGYTEDEVVGKVTPRILKSGGTPPEQYANLWEAILAKNAVKYEIVNKTKEGKRVIVESSANPILDERENITGFLAIQRDVTARKALEDQLRQAQKMEAIGQLAGGVAHDFNNLLTIINGYAQLVLEKLEPDNPLRPKLEEISKAGDRAEALTRQLLAFARRQVLSPQLLNLNDVLAGMERMLPRLIGEAIELVYEPGKELGIVKADQGQIEQVIMNLAVNARDAMPHGGKLTFGTANVELDEGYAQGHAEVVPGRYVLMSVSDNGVGMDAGTLSHIFEPFFTTKERGKGTGLGLSTVFGIVKQSGGHVSAYSEVGLGTTVKIYLPRVEAAAQRAQAQEARSPATMGGKETILLVEDEEALGNLAAKVLEDYGYKVLKSNGGEDALRIEQQYKEPIALLLTDVVMPKMSGRDVAKHLNLLRPKMKVLYMSGYTDDAIVRHGILEDGVYFLQKPFTPGSLARKVREVLDLGREAG